MSIADLKKFFEVNNKVALGFSGGTDSSYLLYAGRKYGADIKAYYVKTCFQPRFEYEDALRLAPDMEVINMDILTDDKVSENGSNRCYYCKMHIFDAICSRAKADGYYTVIDGTNASDDYDDRPGMKALEELQVFSPLRLCGIDKSTVRAESEKAGLFTWNKPAYACLATRIISGNRIDEKTLADVEECERLLMAKGFGDFRIRIDKGKAKIYMSEKQKELTDRYSEYIKEVVASRFELASEEIFRR